MKDTRINIRIPTAEKEVWEGAAASYGMTLSEFVTRSVRSTILSLHQASSGNLASGVGGSFNVIRWPAGTLESH